MEIELLFDNVLVKKIKANDTSVGGIVIPESAQSQYVWVEVVKSGPGKHTPSGVFISTNLEVGEKVLIHSFHVDSNKGLDLNGERVYLLLSTDIYGVQV